MKIYDPDPGKSFTKAKLVTDELRKNGETAIASDAINHLKNFPDDPSVVPTFVPTDALKHLKNDGKNTKRSADAITEFASSKGLRMLPFVHDLQVCCYLC